MNADTIEVIFHQMLQAVENADEERVLELYAVLKSDGQEFSVKNSESVRWTEVNGTRHAIVRQESQLLLGTVTMCHWSGEYAGSYGCMGTGWWVDRVDDGENDIDPSISELLEICEIFLETPIVPEPSETCQ